MTARVYTVFAIVLFLAALGFAGGQDQQDPCNAPATHHVRAR